MYGYFEFEIIQARYIPAGIAFFILSTPLLILFHLLLKILQIILEKILKTKNTLKSVVTIFNSIFLTVLIIIVYALLYFPTREEYLGGAKPIFISLLGDPEQMRFLNEFNMGIEDNSAGNPGVQTKPVCRLYENKDNILIGVIDWEDNEKNGTSIGSVRRIISIRKDIIKGVQYKGGKIGNLQCDAKKFYNL